MCDDVRFCTPKITGQWLVIHGPLDSTGDCSTGAYNGLKADIFSLGRTLQVAQAWAGSWLS